MNVLSDITRICLLSNSDIKLRAVERWLAIKNRSDISINVMAPGPTNCPQPLGERSAFACLERRLLRPFPGDEHTLCIAIENYITCTTSGWWVDRVAVSFTRLIKGQVVSDMVSGNFDNFIPRRFVPKMGPELQMPLGYQQTVGKSINARHSFVPHDNWAIWVALSGIDRSTQIVDALRTLDTEWNLFLKPLSSKSE